MSRVVCSKLWKGAFKFLFSVLVQAIALAATYRAAPDTFSDADLAGIAALGLAVNAVLFSGACFLFRRRRAAADAILALVVLFGIGSAHIVHTDLYLRENRLAGAALCIALGCALFVAFRVIDEQRWGGMTLSSIGLLGLGVIIVWHLTDSGGVSVGDGDVVPIDWTNLWEVSFQETPNLYFISFESIIPRSLLKKYLGTGTSEFHDLFEATFRRFPNQFSSAVGTRPSLGIILSLDVDAHSALREQVGGTAANGSLFSGQQPSALLHILRKNGYETTSIYSDTYLGKSKGEFIENYFLTVSNTVCSLIGYTKAQLSFWGYCGIQHRFFGASYESAIRRVAEQAAGVHQDNGPQFVMAHIAEPRKATHIYGPGFQHSDPEQVEAFRGVYLQRSAKAARFLDLILESVKTNDPNAILFVYGDHGIYMSVNTEFEDDPEFYIHDRYGVLGGIYPPDACSSYFEETLNKGYMSNTEAVHAILRCLSGGESALTTSGDDLIDALDHIDFKEFLYE